MNINIQERWCIAYMCACAYTCLSVCVCVCVCACVRACVRACKGEEVIRLEEKAVSMTTASFWSPCWTHAGSLPLTLIGNVSFDLMLFSYHSADNLKTQEGYRRSCFPLQVL